MQGSDVEIGISHSAGPRWPRRPGRPPVPRQCVTGREGMPPAWTSTDVCASEVRVRQSLLDIWAPPAPPQRHTLSNFKPRGTSHSSGERIGGMQSNRCPRRRGRGARLGSCRKVLHEVLVLWAGERSSRRRDFNGSTPNLGARARLRPKSSSGPHPEGGFPFPVCFLGRLGLFS